jgi:hypothetical protein
MAVRRGEKKRRKRRCRFCRQLFDPSPRLGDRQVACSSRECQKARKKANQENWVRRQPEYFKGRYANTKIWLEQHSSYLAEYRRQHPEGVGRDNERRKIRRERAAETRADIQDSISLQPAVRKALTPYFIEPPSADIQDSIWPQIIMVSVFSANYLQRRYTRLDSPSVDTPLPLATIRTPVLSG